MGYWNQSVQNDTQRSKSEDHSPDGIAVGRDNTSITVVFYNPLTRSYHRPPAFRLDMDHLPVTNFPQSVHYDGSLICGLFCNRTNPSLEPFPPGTRVIISQDNILVRGRIQNIPMPQPPLVSTAADPPPEQDDTQPTYVVHLVSRVTAEVAFEDLVCVGTDTVEDQPEEVDPLCSLAPFLCCNVKLTMDHDGSFQKGYLKHTVEGGFCFEVRQNPRSRKVDFSVPLPDFKRS